MRHLIAALLLLTIAASACTDEAEDTELTITTTTSTTVATTTTSSPPTETTTTVGGDTTTTSPTGMAIEGYDIAVRSSTQEGEVLHVTIEPGDYTDIDLENFVLATLDEREGLAELHVYDDRAAVDAALVAEEERTDEQSALVESHYLVSLADGNVITFHGPFADIGSIRIGS